MPSARDTSGRPATAVAVIGASDTPDAALALLRGLCPSSNLSFIYFGPRGKSVPSQFASVISKETSFRVRTAASGEPPASGTVHVVPPGVLPTLQNGVIHLEPSGSNGRAPGALDRLLSSAADYAGECSVGILLSGSGTDGLEGLRAIRSAGGVALVQDPTTASSNDLLSRALAAGLADRALRPEEIGREVSALAGRVCGGRTAASGAPGVPTPEGLRPILRKLLEHSGVDFSGYKPGTLQRRVSRRMALLGVRDPEGYLRYLDAEPAELEELFEDLLIHVTRFFRDPESYDALVKTVIPAILGGKKTGEGIRVWVPGCSTGEEAYSTAIVFLEALEKARSVHPVQIFASDISERALAHAREGFYPESIRQTVPEDRLRKFFTKTEAGYRIAKRVRDLCVFVRHDLTRNPSFSRLDLVSCRNLLIYFEEELQKRAIEVYHFALRPGGYLVLGESESVEGMAQRFERVSNAGKIFVWKPGAPAVGAGFSLPPLPKVVPAAPPPAPLLGRTPGEEVERQATEALLARHVPAAFLVNERLDVLHLWGPTASFIEIPPGKPELNLLRMIRADLRADVRLALHQALEEGRATRREKIRLPGKATPGRATVDVEPLPPRENSAERFFVVLLRESEAPPSPLGGGKKAGPAALRAYEAEIERLRADLATTVEYSQSFVKSYEAVNANLSAANEEVLSTNEELQSTNEELETAKEELEAANEELQVQNQDLGRLNADLTNLLSSSETAVVMLGRDRRIRRMTVRAQELLGLLPSDQGRPIEDLKAPFKELDLGEVLSEVARISAALSREVRANDGRWHLLQVRPYRTATGDVDGAVLSLHDIDAIKRREEEREQARRALEESEKRFRRLADSAPVLIWTSGSDALRTYFNRPWLDFRGRSMDQELGDGWSEGVHPQDHDRCLKTYLGAFEARRPFETEYRLRRGDGAYRWILDRGVPLHLSDGTFTGFIGSCLDVTERKEAEGARARLAAIVESSDDAIVAKSLDGIVTDWNRAAERLFGYAHAEIVGKPITLIIPEDRWDEERQILDKVASGERILHFETVRRHKGGASIDVSLTVSPIKDDSGRVVGISKIARDITERKRAQAASARLAAIVESSDDAIVSKNLQGIVTSWNGGAERLFGYRAEEMVGKSITLIIPGERLSEETHILSKIAKGEPVEHFDTIRRRKDGSLVDISLTVSPIKDAEGRIIGASKVARDITERKRVEAHVRELNEGLERRVRERTSELEAFSYTIAHDLRAPLRTVHRFGDILLDEYGDRLDEEGRDFLKRMAEGAARMDRLIQDLLDYSRAARVETHLKPVDLEEILSGIRADLAAELQERKATLQVEQGFPPVLGDKVLLRQALSNLVENAVKFVKAGTAPEVRVGAEMRDGRIRINVRDNGIGIDPQYYDKLFKIFERLNAGDTYPGTGVGLAIVKKLVERMKGRLGVESAVGCGSCFWIELQPAGEG